MSSNNVLEAVAEIGSECYRERDKLRDEVERLKQDIAAAMEAYTAGIFQTAARCAQIADEHASVEGIAQQIGHAIRDEFLLGYGAEPPEFGLGESPGFSRGGEVK